MQPTFTRSALAAAIASTLWLSTAPAQDNAQNTGGSNAGPAPEWTSMPPGDWWTINRDPAATRYSPLDQINTGNVSRLTESWSYALGGNSTAVPLVVDGVMYLPSGDRVVALDGDSGEEVWSYALSGPEEGRRAVASTRGVSFWPGDDDHAPRILFTSGARLIALDAASGQPAEGFGENGAVDVGVPYGGAPAVYRHAAVIGAAVGELPRGPAGNSRAFDVRTGEKLWEFQTVPQPGEPYHETWIDGWEERSGTNMWAFTAPVDVERGLVYMAIASPSPNYYGGGRPGDNVYGNSIVAVDALTGEYVWHFQTVRHDLWDADMPSTGGLFDFVDEGGRRVPALAHVGKPSYFFVLDRETGEPLIEVEDRPVPQGDVPGEWYSPTQPFPVRPEPLSRVSFDAETDLVTPEDTTPEHAAACRELMERSGGFYNEGPFTPFMYRAPGEPPRSTIQLPGGIGGVNWGGVTIDPETGLVYVNAHDTSLVGWLEDRDPEGNYGAGTAGSDQPYDRGSILGPGPYFSFNAPIGGEFDEAGRPVGPTAPCYRPPWSRLTAIDPNAGEIVWTAVLGLNENLPPDRQLVGNTGSAGPSVTAGGLVFVGATNDQRFRAFDSSTGEELWVARLEGNANANPMTYLGSSGRQHVAVVAGGRVVSFALPAAAALAQEAPWYPSQWGADDQRGAANRLTPEKVLEAREAITAGVTYELGRVYEAGIPLSGTRHYSLRIPQAFGPIGENEFLYLDEIVSGELGQIGTQFDGLGHVGIGDTFYNGNRLAEIAQAEGLARLGVEHVGPIMTRGVLIDMAGHKDVAQLEGGYEITVEDIEAALEAQGAEIRGGDVVLFHTGWGSLWMEDNERYLQSAPGIGIDAAQYLVDREVVLVGADTWIVEVVPNPDPALAAPVHQLLVARNGIYLLENIATEMLADDAVYEFAFFFAPVPLKGATGSPGNPVAIR